MLAKNNANYTNIKPVIIEQYAEVPFTAVKPKKELIIVLGVLLGGMLGVLLAFIRTAVRTRKEKKQLEAKTLLT